MKTIDGPAPTPRSPRHLPGSQIGTWIFAERFLFSISYPGKPSSIFDKPAAVAVPVPPPSTPPRRHPSKKERKSRILLTPPNVSTDVLGVVFRRRLAIRHFASRIPTSPREYHADVALSGMWPTSYTRWLFNNSNPLRLVSCRIGDRSVAQRALKNDLVCRSPGGRTLRGWWPPSLKGMRARPDRQEVV